MERDTTNDSTIDWNDILRRAHIDGEPPKARYYKFFYGLKAAICQRCVVSQSRGDRLLEQWMERKTHPSITRLCPTTRLILGELSNTTTSPISLGSAVRPCRCSYASHAFEALSVTTSFSFINESWRLVRTKPGDTALILTPCWRASRDAFGLENRCQ